MTIPQLGRTLAPAAALVCSLAVGACAAEAAAPAPGPAPAVLADTTSLKAYWYGFLRYWSKSLVEQDGIILTVVVVMVVSIFIITRGKWRK
ncbi:MAG TPA: hypothetical protein VIL46_13120 [Gemmataceae bacterium]